MRRLRLALLALIIVNLCAVIGWANVGPVQPPAPQPQWVQLTDQSLPHLFRKLGYQIEEGTFQGRLYWNVKAQNGGRITSVIVDPVRNPEGKMTGFWLLAAMGTRTNAGQQIPADALLKLLKLNNEIFPYFFSYGEQTGYFYLNYEFPYGSTNEAELDGVFSKFLGKVNEMQPHCAFTGANPTGPPSMPAVKPLVSVSSTIWKGTATLENGSTFEFALAFSGPSTDVVGISPPQGGTASTKWVQVGSWVNVVDFCEGTLADQKLAGTVKLADGRKGTFQLTYQKGGLVPPGNQIPGSSAAAGKFELGNTNWNGSQTLPSAAAVSFAFGFGGNVTMTEGTGQSWGKYVQDGNLLTLVFTTRVYYGSINGTTFSGKAWQENDSGTKSEWTFSVTKAPPAIRHGQPPEQYLDLTTESVPKMLGQAGFKVESKVANARPFWLVTDSSSGTTVLVEPRHLSGTTMQGLGFSCPVQIPPKAVNTGKLELINTKLAPKMGVTVTYTPPNYLQIVTSHDAKTSNADELKKIISKLISSGKYVTNLLGEGSSGP